MFFRIVRAAGGKGVQHEYVRLVESYREHGKPKQRVVCNLGRKDLLVANLDSLNRLLGAGEPADTERAAEQIAGADAWDWGPMVVTATLWRELGLEQILDRLGGRGKRDGVALSERALVLVANRLCAPSSEHGLARWLETDFVCDRQGRRWVPQWRDDGERRASRSPRVRVESRQLKQWYRTLDQLHGHLANFETSFEIFFVGEVRTVPRVRSKSVLDADRFVRAEHLPLLALGAVLSGESTAAEIGLLGRRRESLSWWPESSLPLYQPFGSPSHGSRRRRS